MAERIAIIGDRFMLPSVFAEKVSEAVTAPVDIATREDAWPDEPMEHGTPSPAWTG